MQTWRFMHQTVGSIKKNLDMRVMVHDISLAALWFLNIYFTLDLLSLKKKTIIHLLWFIFR